MVSFCHEGLIPFERFTTNTERPLGFDLFRYFPHTDTDTDTVVISCVFK